MPITTEIFSTCHGRSVRTFMALFLVFSFTLAHGESSEEYLKEAENYEQKGDINAAIIQLKNALQKDPKNVKARFLLGKNYLTRGDGAGAEKELTRAQSLGMARQEIVAPLGRAMLLQGLADDVLEKIKIEKDFPVDIKSDVHVIRANAHIILKQNAEAEKEFVTAIGLNPKSLNALAGQTRLAVISQDYEKANKLAAVLIKSHPDSDAAWVMHGEVSRLTGNMQSALESFDKAISLQKYNLPALLGSAGVNLVLGNSDEAAKRIDAIQRISPNQPMAN